ncbi:SIS domain-containing protein [Labrys wisconsinensis]|uniref:6-phospho-3-hexuloisomerase n=1 Tax=Labrys wisconsinensis TaxID=425677 RepID=A0ABU0J2Y5_9HYPH|nr:SIS domain-containing protein [Labrys wisconsinensis]MDQ0468622.1 6-phospho-3-hexuloisomerase [Labrys wisconsinensis]
MTDTIPALALRALDDLAGVFRVLPETAADALVDALATARRIAIYGAGREGLQMRGFAMRLFHLGLDVSVVADMTVPPLGAGDLLFVSSGPGASNIGDALMRVAREAGARTAVVTAQPEGRTPQAADVVLTIPAQTMADDRGAAVSVLPMGSLFETAQVVLFEILILKLRDRLGETAESMRARHTNLE